MIDHLSSYTTDYGAARAFYDVVLGALAYPLAMELVAEWDKEFPNRHMAAYGPDKKPVFWLIEVKQAASPRHVAFQAADRAAVDRFHAAGKAAGGRENGPPGLRKIYHPDYYAAFLIDPDGNNVEAVCHRPE